MDKSQLFEFYEILALILPGAVTLYGINKLFPGLMLFSNGNEFSAGEFGVFILIAYTTGHIVQVLGGLVERVWRRVRGNPSDWIKSGNKQLIFEFQIDDLERKISKRLGVSSNEFHLSNLTRREWLNMLKQMKTAIDVAGRTGRHDKFEAIYMMCRGLIAALLILAFSSALSVSLQYWYIPYALLALALILLYRMARFERHAMRELFIQFLQLPESDKK